VPGLAWLRTRAADQARVSTRVRARADGPSVRSRPEVRNAAEPAERRTGPEGDAGTAAPGGEADGGTMVPEPVPAPPVAGTPAAAGDEEGGLRQPDPAAAEVRIVPGLGELALAPDQDSRRWKPPAMSSSDARSASVVRPPLPWWGRFGVGINVVLAMTLAAVIAFTPTFGSGRAASAHRANRPPAAKPSSPAAPTGGTSQALGGSGQAPGGSGASAVGGGGAGGRGSSTGAGQPPPLAIRRHALREATALEFAAVAQAVTQPGQPVDSVLIAVSDDSWGVVHVAAGAGGSPEFVLMHRVGGWQPVASGYPQFPCYQPMPVDVQADLGLLMAGCS